MPNGNPQQQQTQSLFDLNSIMTQAKRSASSRPLTESEGMGYAEQQSGQRLKDLAGGMKERDFLGRDVPTLGPQDKAGADPLPGYAMYMAGMNPMATLRSAAGTAVGSGVGGWAGREAGRPWGRSGEEWGGKLGSLAGGAYGAVQGWRGLELPSRGNLLSRVLGAAERETPAEVDAAAAPKAAAVVDAQQPSGDVEARARAAGLWTPRSSAQETGMWHAGQGEAPNPAMQTPENTRLFEKIRRGEGMPTPRTESPSYPTARSTAPAYKQGEGTSAVNLVEGEAPRVNPQQQAQSEAWDRQRLADIIRNPKATPEEIAYARTALGGGGATGSW